MWKYYSMVNCFEVTPIFDAAPSEAKAQVMAAGLGPLVQQVSEGMQTLPQAHGVMGEIVSHDIVRCGNTMILTSIIRYRDS